MIRPVFLSASVPDPRRDTRYFETADITPIRESVIALASIVLPFAPLVFGGHPAISPLVLLVASGLSSVERVRIFQSRYFENVIPPDSREFPNFVWTPAVRDNRAASLKLMRERMLEEGPFEAAFFIGGMDGVEEEFSLFRNRWPTTPGFPVASTGAERILLDRHRESMMPYLDEDSQLRLRDEAVYRPLLQRLVIVEIETDEYPLWHPWPLP